MTVSVGGGIPQASGEVAQLPPLLSFKTVESLGFSRETGWIVGFFREGFFSSLKVTLHGLTDTTHIPWMFSHPYSYLLTHPFSLGSGSTPRPAGRPETTIL